MGKTAVDTGVMDQQAAQIDAILRMLNRAAGTMKDSRKALEWNEAASARLRQSVRSACEDTAALSERMEALKKVLAQIAEEYRRTEQALTGKEGRGAGGSAGTGQAGGGNKKSVDLDEFLKWLGKIFGAVDGKGIPFAGAVLGWLGGLLDLSTSEKLTPAELYEKMASIMGSGYKGVGKLFKWLGNSSVAGQAGLIGAALALSGSVGKALFLGDTSELLKNLDSVISDTAGLTKAYYTLKMGPEALKGLTSKIAALSAAVTMGTHFTGSILEGFQDDGVYDILDYANTLLDTGVSGGSALIKGCTFGIVDIDVDGAKNIYISNSNAMAEAINNTGAETWQKVLMLVPAVPVTAAASTLEALWSGVTKWFK